MKKITRKRNKNNSIRMKRGESALIIEMDDTMYVEMLEKGKINIGWRKCHVADYVNVKRCFNC